MGPVSLYRSAPWIPEGQAAGAKVQAPCEHTTPPLPHLCPTSTPGSLLLSPSHFRQSFCTRNRFPDSHGCTCIWRTFVSSLKRSVWLVRSGAGKERNSKRFFASDSAWCDPLNSSAALRPKDCKSRKRFSLMCQCAKRSSYLNSYLGQREALPRSTCPHFFSSKEMVT